MTCKREEMVIVFSLMKHHGATTCYKIIVCYIFRVSVVRIYLGGTLSGTLGLRDLDVLDLDGVLAVAMRVMQLAHIDCGMLGMWRGGL